MEEKSSEIVIIRNTDYKKIIHRVDESNVKIDVGENSIYVELTVNYNIFYVSINKRLFGDIPVELDKLSDILKGYTLKKYYYAFRNYALSEGITKVSNKITENSIVTIYVDWHNIDICFLHKNKNFPMKAELLSLINETTKIYRIENTDISIQIFTINAEEFKNYERYCTGGKISKLFLWLNSNGFSVTSDERQIHPSKRILHKIFSELINEVTEIWVKRNDKIIMILDRKVIKREKYEETIKFADESYVISFFNSISNSQYEWKRVDVKMNKDFCSIKESWFVIPAEWRTFNCDYNLEKIGIRIQHAANSLMTNTPYKENVERRRRFDGTKLIIYLNGIITEINAVITIMEYMYTDMILL